MNSLTYISRQFDVLASTSSTSIRSAPPSPSPNRHRNIHDENTPSSSAVNFSATSPSLSLPNIRTRRASQPSSVLRGRSKAQAFLQGPRRNRRTASFVVASSSALERATTETSDPANVPLPPSPSSSSPTLPVALFSTQSSLLSSPPYTSTITHRSSPSPTGIRKRRRRKTISLVVLRPLVGLWNLILSAWLWLLGKEGPIKRTQLSSYLMTGKAKQQVTPERHATPVSDIKDRLSGKEYAMDDQSDATLVDSDSDEDKRPTLVELDDQDQEVGSSSSSLQPFPPSRPDSIGIEDDPNSFATSNSILLNSPTSISTPSSISPPTSILQSSSSNSSGRVKISLPPFANMMGGSMEENRASRGKLTPWPSQERIRQASLDSALARRDKADRDDDDDDEDEEVEVDNVLMRRRRTRLTSMPSSLSSTPTSLLPSQSSSLLTALDLNIPSLPLEDSDNVEKRKGKGKQAERSSTLPLPRTIVTPPSSVDLTSPPNATSNIEEPSSGPSSSPSPSSEEEAQTKMTSPPSRTLLPNRLGNSYLTPSSRRSGSSRRSSADSTMRQSYLQQAQSSGAGPSARTKTPFHMPKTLVLDLDETLIHSTSSRNPLPLSSSSSSGLFNELGGLFVGGGSGGGFGGMGLFSSGLLAGAGGLLGKGGDKARAGHMVEVVLNGRVTLYTVYKRPFVDYFLRKVSGWYTLVVFTASMQEYADPVIDWLDGGRGILSKRLFRESCTQLPNGSYAKDLSQIDPDLSRICLLDNSPISYSLDQANGIPIEGWYSDPSDEALLDLLPVLDSLRFTGDVRRVLGIKAF